MIQELVTGFFSGLISFVEHYRTPMLLLVCLALGAAGARLMADIPFREHLLDQPNGRSSHDVPTPRGGGVGILVAFIVAAMTLRVPTTFLFAAVLVTLVSFYGDYFRISVRFRLAIQFISGAVLLIPLAPRLSFYSDFSVFAISPVLFVVIMALVLLFVMGSANIYNFMDGINGMAGLSGVIGFGLMGLFTLNRPGVSEFEASLALLSLCIALACLGYLPFNMPRARVFMGDVGSILSGFSFAALVIMLARNYRDMLCFAALLFPLYADTLTTMCIRFRAGERLTQPHRQHLYQLMVNELGWDHWKVTTMYGTVQLAVGIGVLTAYTVGFYLVMILLVLSFFTFTLVSLRVRRALGASRSNFNS